MTKNEYIALRIEELEARRSYAAQYILNKQLEHEVKMCDAQIQALMNERDLQVINLPKIGPPVQQLWRKDPQNYLMHTDDDGVDTVLCENHLTDPLTACENCGPWPDKI